MKYEILRQNFIKLASHTLYQIRSLSSFGNISPGTLGGYVQSEFNLSQEGNCWVYPNGSILEQGRVFGDAKIYKGYVTSHARVFDEAVVTGDSIITGEARVSELAKIDKKSTITEVSDICGKALIEYSSITGHAEVGDNAIILRSRISGYARVMSNSVVEDCFVEYGIVRSNLTKDIVKKIYHAINVLPINGVYTFLQPKNQFNISDHIIIQHLREGDEFIVVQVAIENIVNVIDKDVIIRNPLKTEDHSIYSNIRANDSNRLQLLIEDL